MLTSWFRHADIHRRISERKKRKRVKRACPDWTNLEDWSNLYYFRDSTNLEDWSYQYQFSHRDSTNLEDWSYQYQFGHRDSTNLEDWSNLYYFSHRDSTNLEDWSYQYQFGDWTNLEDRKGFNGLAVNGFWERI